MTEKSEDKEKVQPEKPKADDTVSGDDVHAKLLEAIKDSMADNKKTREAVSDFMAKVSEAPTQKPETDKSPSQETDKKPDKPADSEDVSLNADEINTAIVSKF